jgi:hypothetical protein
MSSIWWKLRNLFPSRHIHKSFNLRTCFKSKVLLIFCSITLRSIKTAHCMFFEHVSAPLFVYVWIFLSLSVLSYSMLSLPIYVYPSIYLSVCLSVRPSVRPSVRLSLSVCLPVCLSGYPSVYPSVYLFIYLSVYVSLCIYKYSFK